MNYELYHNCESKDEILVLQFSSIEGKTKGTDEAVCEITSPGIILYYLPPGSGDVPPLSQPKPVLNLATPDGPDGCKAE